MSSQNPKSFTFCIAAAGCNNLYTLTLNTNTFNGVLQTSITDVDGCRSACNSDATCAGFDFDTNPGTNSKCYLHTSFPGTAVASGVNQYRITVRTCVGPSGNVGAGGSVGG